MKEQWKKRRGRKTGTIDQ